MEMNSLSKPLSGKVYYLDVRPSKRQEQLKYQLLKLGAHLEDFLSKDVNFLVTDRLEHTPGTTTDSTPKLCTGFDSWFPDTPVSGLPSPTFTKMLPLDQDIQFPDSPLTDSFRTPTSLQPAVQSRGQALLERAKHKVQKRGSADVLEVSRQWGIKILPVKTLLQTLENLLKTAAKASQVKESPRKKKIGDKINKLILLHSPYIKVEDMKREYRPFYKELEEHPNLWGDKNKNIPVPLSEDENEEMRTANNKVRSAKKSPINGHKKLETGLAAKAKEMFQGNQKAQAGKAIQQKRKMGYCEICGMSYGNLAKHVLTRTHSTFMCNEINFGQLKELVTQLPSIKSLKKKKRPLAEQNIQVTPKQKCNPVPSLHEPSAKQAKLAESSSPLFRTKTKRKSAGEPLFSDTEDDDYVEPSCSTASCDMQGCLGGYLCISGPLFKDCPSSCIPHQAPSHPLRGPNIICLCSSSDSSPHIPPQPLEAHQSSSSTVPFISLDIQPLNLSYKPKPKSKPSEPRTTKDRSEHVFFSENACASTLGLAASAIPAVILKDYKEQSLSFSNIEFSESSFKCPPKQHTGRTVPRTGGRKAPEAIAEPSPGSQGTCVGAQSVRKVLFQSDSSSSPNKAALRNGGKSKQLFDSSDQSFSSCSYSDQLMDAVSTSSEA